MTLLYRIYQLLFIAPFLALSTLLTTLSTGLGCMMGLHRWFAFYPSQAWGYTLIRALFLPVEVRGREHLQKGQSYVFVANHQGAFDIFFLCGFLGREFKWMLKASLRHMPFVGFACEKAGYIFVDRSSRSAVNRTMQEARERLIDGTSLMVFPEGTRTHDGRLGTFRRGAFQLADELQLPVVPITLDGCFDLLPRDKGLSFVRWHRLRMTIHAPIVPTCQGSDNVRSTLKAAHAAINSALPERYKTKEQPTAS